LRAAKYRRSKGFGAFLKNRRGWYSCAIFGLLGATVRYWLQKVSSCVNKM
jgi:hypothetical protein